MHPDEPANFKLGNEYFNRDNTSGLSPAAPQQGLRSRPSNHTNTPGQTAGDDSSFPGGNRDARFTQNGFSNGVLPKDNFGGNRMPSYGENRQPIAGMNFMQDFGGQTMVIQSGLRNTMTGVGMKRRIDG